MKILEQHRHNLLRTVHVLLNTLDEEFDARWDLGPIPSQDVRSAISLFGLLEPYKVPIRNCGVYWDYNPYDPDPVDEMIDMDLYPNYIYGMSEHSPAYMFMFSKYWYEFYSRNEQRLATARRILYFLECVDTQTTIQWDLTPLHYMTGKVKVGSKRYELLQQINSIELPDYNRAMTVVDYTMYKQLEYIPKYTVTCCNRFNEFTTTCCRIDGEFVITMDELSGVNNCPYCGKKLRVKTNRHGNYVGKLRDLPVSHSYCFQHDDRSWSCYDVKILPSKQEIKLQ